MSRRLRDGEGADWTLERLQVSGSSGSSAASAAPAGDEPLTGRSARTAAAVAAASPAPAATTTAIAGGDNGTPSEAAPAPPPVDPIRWFGVLVSPHLRKSQERFVQALPLLVTLANRQAELQQTYERYAALKAAAAAASTKEKSTGVV